MGGRKARACARVTIVFSCNSVSECGASVSMAATQVRTRG